jgi:hypothetical protein
MASEKVKGSEPVKIFELSECIRQSEDSASESDVELEDDIVYEKEQSADSATRSESDDKIDTADENDRAAAGPSQSKRVRQEPIEWVWATTKNNPVIHPFTESSGVSEYLFNKYAAESPSELSVFLGYMDPLFSVIATETNNYAQKQLLNDGGKKEK